MTDQQQQNSSGGPSNGSASQTGGSSGDPQRPNDAAVAAAAEAARSAAAPQRPDWATDDVWDAEKGIRGDVIKERLTKAQQLEAEIEARKAAIPEDPNGYKAELPDDVLKALPADREIKPDDPMWGQFREIAKAAGLTQEQFKNLAGFKVKLDLAAEQANKEAIARHSKSIHDSLGANGAEQVEATKTWMKGFFGDALGEQFQHAIFTTDMAKAWQRIQQDYTSQGVTSFSQAGRQGAPDPTKIPGYEGMSFEQRWNAATTKPAANGRA